MSGSFREIGEHRIYELLEDRYLRVGCDYVMLSSADEYKGVETHQKAVICAFGILNDRYSSNDLDIDIEPDKMTAVRISVDDLLELPSDEPFAGKEKSDRSYTVSKPIPYWYAFLEPPDGTPYVISDFIEFNDVLIPDKDSVEAYRWNDGFSNYFDAGREWWGTGLWSIFDNKTGIFTVIGASMTD